MNDQPIPKPDLDSLCTDSPNIGLKSQPLINPRPRQSFSLSPGERAGVRGSVEPNQYVRPDRADESPDLEHAASKSRPGGSLFDVFPSLRLLKDICDYIGGSREEAPAGYRLLTSPWLMGLWWGLLAGLILLFCGQTSKFIYIDF